MTLQPGTAQRQLPYALRVRVDAAPVVIRDLLAGASTHNLARFPGDFVVRRKEGLIAYQLAVVVDDAAQQVTHVVRGADLFDNTPRQQFLQQLLGLTTPEYLHLPLVRDIHGRKLSKQTNATALDNHAPGANLTRVLGWLGHEPPASLRGTTPETLLGWASTAWRRCAIPRMLEPERLEAGLPPVSDSWH
jgi:glutamyl-Q tRNA(Asp) synthetase